MNDDECQCLSYCILCYMVDFGLLWILNVDAGARGGEEVWLPCGCKAFEGPKPQPFDESIDLIGSAHFCRVHRSPYDMSSAASTRHWWLGCDEGLAPSLNLRCICIYQLMLGRQHAGEKWKPQCNISFPGGTAVGRVALMVNHLRVQFRNPSSHFQPSAI